MLHTFKGVESPCSKLTLLHALHCCLVTIAVLQEQDITCLPAEVLQLELLEELVIRNCRSLEYLVAEDASLCRLRKLRRLEVEMCPALKALPNSLGQLEDLQELIVDNHRVAFYLEALSRVMPMRLKLQQLQQDSGPPVGLWSRAAWGVAASIAQLLPGPCRHWVCSRQPSHAVWMHKYRWYHQPPLGLSWRASRMWSHLQGRLKYLQRAGYLDTPQDASPDELLACICHKLQELSLHEPLTPGLKDLPASITSLKQLRVLSVHSTTLERLPENLGNLASLEVLHVAGCSSLTLLPESACLLQNLVRFNNAGSGLMRDVRPGEPGFVLCMVCRVLVLVTPLLYIMIALSMILRPWQTALVCKRAFVPYHNWILRATIRDITAFQLRRQNVYKLAQQQAPMLSTLEHMSWLVMLFATATFIAFLQPPGGYADDKQVLVGNYSSCQPSGEATAGLLPSGRACALFWFFVFDALSFSLSIGCVVFIVVASMPGPSSST